MTVKRRLFFVGWALLIAGFAISFKAHATVPPQPPFNQVWSEEANSGPIRYIRPIQGNLRRDLAPYLRQFERTCEFLTRMQEPDEESPNFGGLHEGESEQLWAIVETDNTQESIRVWCEYALRFEDADRYRANIEAAWEYCDNFPAWEESEPGEMYGLHNSGWGLLAEMAYRRAYDESHHEYGIDCADHLVEHTPRIQIDMEDRLMPLVAGWAAGTLYLYGELEDNDQYRASALQIAADVKAWIEHSPERLNQNEIWALCGGTAMWGVLQSWGRAEPEQAVDWMSELLEQMDVFAGQGQWNNSWNIWYAHAWIAAYELGGDEDYLSNAAAIVDSLVSLDGDEDGGIPATIGDDDDLDQSWVSAYTAWMGFTNLFPTLPEADPALIRLLSPAPNRPWPVDSPLTLSVLTGNDGALPRLTYSLAVRDFAELDTLITVDGYQPVEISWRSPLIINEPGMTNLTIVASHEDDPNQVNDTLRVNLDIRATSQVRFSVSNEENRAVRCRFFIWHNEIEDHQPLAIIEIDSLSGSASVELMAGMYQIRGIPSFPYAQFTIDDLEIIPDRNPVELDVSLRHPPVLLINRDTDSSRSVYFTAELDSWLRYYHWQSEAEGDLTDRTDGFQSLIYYTGNREHDVIPEADQDEIQRYLDQGGNVFITGQNIADDLADSDFLEQTLRSRRLVNATRARIVAGVADDPFGDGLEMLLLGNRGANNQNSPAGIEAVNGGIVCAVYQNRADTAAAVRWEEESGGRGIFFAFGFEGISGQSGSTRRNVMLKVLNWLRTPLNINQDDLPPALPKSSATAFAWPNPTNGVVNLHFDETSNKDGWLMIFDIRGRLVNKLPVSNSPIAWNGLNFNGMPVPSGIYYLNMRNGTTIISALRVTMVR